MNIFFVRHGESEGNSQRVHQGENADLSEKGRHQAQLVAKRLQDHNIQVIYCSPFLRAKQTAEIIAAGLKLPITFAEDLKELRRPSEIEGLSYGDPKAEEIKSIIKQNQTIPDWRYSDDESFNDIVTRAKSIEKILFDNHHGQNVLCVSHVQIIVMITLHIILQEKLTPEVFWQFYYHARYNNTGITHLQHNETFGWNLMTWNNTVHLS